MNKYIIISIFTSLSLLFLVNQMGFLKINAPYAPTHIFTFYSLLGMALHIAASILFIKFCGQTWSKWNIISAILIFVSLASIAFLENESGTALMVTSYMGYAILALGIFDYWKNKHKINCAFIIWGIYILLWNTNFYELFS